MNLRQRLWFLLGLEPSIVAACSPKYQRRYARTGFMLALVALACLISGGYAFYLITDYIVPAVPFGMVWAWMIINLYRLTLVTVGNKFILPASKVRFPLFSMLVRIVFLGMLAFFISKPLEILVFNASITPHLVIHKEKTLAANQEQLDWVEGSEKVAPGDTHYYQKRVLSSGYFIQRLRILQAQHPNIIWFTLSFAFVFLLPFLRQIRRSYVSEYEEKRAELERALILADYEEFKLAYAEAFSGISPDKVEWYERYADAPFNTELKKTEDVTYNRRGSLTRYTLLGK